MLCDAGPRRTRAWARRSGPRGRAPCTRTRTRRGGESSCTGTARGYGAALGLVPGASAAPPGGSFGSQRGGCSRGAGDPGRAGGRRPRGCGHAAGGWSGGRCCCYSWLTRWGRPLVGYWPTSGGGEGREARREGGSAQAVGGFRFRFRLRLTFLTPERAGRHVPYVAARADRACTFTTSTWNTVRTRGYSCYCLHAFRPCLVGKNFSCFFI